MNILWHFHWLFIVIISWVWCLVLQNIVTKWNGSEPDQNQTNFRIQILKNNKCSLLTQSQVSRVSIQTVYADDQVGRGQWAGGLGRLREVGRRVPEGLDQTAMGFPGLWIRIHFMRIRIQQFFWMRIRIRIQVQVQLNQIWRKKSWRVFLSCKKHKRLLKSKKKWSLCKFTFFKLIKLQLLAISLHFFSF